MKENLKFEINYIAYKSSDELPENYKLLVDAAKKATNDSYAPYSNFNVGAALFLNDGQIILGRNQCCCFYCITH